MRYRDLTESQRAMFEIVDPQSIDSIDQPDDYYYHVTTRPSRVMQSGIRPNQAPSMDAGFYRQYSAGKVFFCERPGVPYWLWRIGDHLEQRFERPPRLSVVRFPKSLVSNPQVDRLGTDDSRIPSYFVTHLVR